MERTRQYVAGWLLIALLVVGGPAWADVPDSKNAAANRLAQQTSPYLLMHAHNPVDWYPWGPEAFAKAKKEGKLVFLSIGYSSCYWCHVMERESFGNADVAKVINQLFVAIKVDREERPDIDNTYMTALHCLGERGGWPLSMFLTADGKPIVGGTYWPPEDREIEGKTARGFKSVLKFVHDWYTKKPQEVEGQATKLAELTTDALVGHNRGTDLVKLDRALVTGALDAIKEEYDSQYGGFGNPARGFRGAKFPTAPYLELLLAEAERTKSPELTGMLTQTLDRMAQGGIYDQLGGGFHRYSTERTWTVPHFEKMLYDNAQLAEVYAKAYRLTQRPLYRRVVAETLAFVSRDLTARKGSFYSALDAETEGQEGRYYVWIGKELEEVLDDKADLALVRKIYGADEQANFESKYHILTLRTPLEETAKAMNLSPSQLEDRLAPLRQKLLEARSARPRPFLDTKVLTGWNGQMIAAFAVGGQVLKEAEYVQAAVQAADFILRHLRNRDGRLARTFGAAPGKTGEARLTAFLEDYAYLVHGLLCLHDATGDAKWLRDAKALTDTMIRYYEDKDRGGFFFTANDQEKLFARARDQYDSAQPSGNSVAAANLVRLWVKTGDVSYRALAEKTMKSFAGSLKANPSSLTAMARALALYLDAKEQPAQDEPAKDGPGPKGGAKRSDSVVKVKAEAGKPDADGKQLVTLTFTIDDDWHIYANPVAKDFPGIPTTITVTAYTKPEEVKVDYPKGKLVKDEFTGDYYVYEGTLAIKTTVRRAKDDTSPLQISVKVQACNQSKCLLPATIKLKAP
jgi:uncharacterized protein YyaL (SSP411 family)